MRSAVSFLSVLDLWGDHRAFCLSCDLRCISRWHFRAVSSLQPVAGSTHSASTPVAGNTVQPSPEFLAAVVQAVKASLATEQASVSRPDSSWNSSVLDQATESSSLAMLGAFPASALWTAGNGFLMHSSLAQVSLSQGRPAFVVPSFVRKFAPPESIARVVLRYHCLASCVSGWPLYK